MNLDNLVSYNNPKSPISEAYRTLRTNIQFSSYDSEINTISVTSASPGDGKTTTICNLAITMAGANQRVLLIDADLRKPQIHKRFNLHNARGVTNALAQDMDIDDLVIKSPIEGLHLLLSGPTPPNPSELLGSNKMKEFLNEVSKKYDKILIDCPPVGVVTDPAILSTIVDGTIVVVSSGKTHIEEARKAKQLLGNVNANILGIVLNKIPINSRGYYGYYHYYSDEEMPSKRGLAK